MSHEATIAALRRRIATARSLLEPRDAILCHLQHDPATPESALLWAVSEHIAEAVLTSQIPHGPTRQVLVSASIVLRASAARVQDLEAHLAPARARRPWWRRAWARWAGR